MKKAFFTHDKIYFGNKKVLNNKELQGKYNFASADGKDVVITGGYIKKHKTYFKYVTHGLSYEHKEYGAFDILILYTEKSIQNLRVFCAGKVFVDDRRGRVYIMEMEDGEKVVPTYEIAQYDKKINFKPVRRCLALPYYLYCLRLRCLVLI